MLRIMWNLLDLMTYISTLIQGFTSVRFHSQSKVFVKSPSFRIKKYFIALVENPVQNQESIAWIESRLNRKSYLGKSGQPVFRFKDYLVRYIRSIAPYFQVNEIVGEALYMASNKRDDREDCAGGFIHTRTPQASSELIRILDGRNISDMFPGIKNLKISKFYSEIKVGIWTDSKLVSFRFTGRERV